MRVSKRNVLLFGFALLLLLAATLPLKLAIGWLGLDDRGLSARAATGSLWSGRLEDARFGQVPLGSPKVSLQLAPLLIGRARLDFHDAGPNAGLRQGGLSLSRHEFAVDDVTARFDMAALVPIPAPQAALNLTDVSIRFRNGRCETAEGQVSTDFLARLSGLGGWQGPTLTGSARCDNGEALLPLAGTADGIPTALEIRIDGKGRRKVMLEIRNPPAELASSLTARGFVQSGDSYRLTAEGRL